ncbi:uncharacterized protein LOC124919184 isoform X2 [Impatiens glandulifera]|uniref:uncharacterized protein LOC124919184 isoform X2 n=1 Tax=Impatiens glandulifera TaxID=253017 RepID=UPI001FB1892D|nr:uncharacterized protein LOC124919184 isoform X2 [Impatiens glandulifera]
MLTTAPTAAPTNTYSFNHTVSLDLRLLMCHSFSKQLLVRGRHQHLLVPSPRPNLSLFQVYCTNSKPTRGFGPSPTTDKKDKFTSSTPKVEKDVALGKRNPANKQSSSVTGEAPGLSFQNSGSLSNSEIQFEEKLEAVKRAAIEKKRNEGSKEFGAIDYDATMEPKSKTGTIGLGTKIGVGVAVVVFGLVFALGDFLPSGSNDPGEEAPVLGSKLTEQEKTSLENRLQKYEATLNAYPQDLEALEGSAVTLAELGEYTRAAALLEDLCEKKSNDPEIYRLLGEVKYALKDYEGSVAAYRKSSMVSSRVNFDVLRGLTNALLAAKKPDEAVQILLTARESLKTEILDDKEANSVDPIQVELLLGRAFSDWGHVSDAVNVYDQLITNHPDDFRGYLAKGIILKENGSVGDAERMFIQARFFAPVKVKALVDSYSRK